jgi:SAM-dependent methyltransferase
LELEFYRWFLEQPGALVLRQEREAVAAIAPRLFGYQLIQLGLLGPDLDYFGACPIRSRTVVSASSSASCGAVFVRGNPEQLPIAADSADAVVMAHTLDLANDPPLVLREVERVLIPEGRLVLIGFNPFSLWGLRRRLGTRRAPPWSCNFISYPQLHDWLSLLGFAVERTDVLMFRPPIAHPSLLERFAFLDRQGERLWPMLAGVYVVQAIKRVSTLTPITLPWRRRRLIRASAIEPSARGMRHG